MYYIHNRTGKRFPKKKKGVTIVELITALSCLTLILTIAIVVFRMGVRANFNTKEEYKLQSYMRQATDLVTEKIRYSSAVFILPASEFNKKNIEKNSYLQDDWDYIGAIETELEDGRQGYEIVMYQYNPDAGEGGTRHMKTVLVPATDQFHFDMNLSKPDPSVDNKLIKFVLSAFKYGMDDAYMEVDSKADALNSLQIQDYSTSRDAGRAIAFRSDSRFSIIGRVVLVLDVSSSMRYYVESNEPAPEGESRMDLLSPLVEKMIEEFAKYQNLELCIITYDDTADLGRFNDFKYDRKEGEALQRPPYEGDQYYFLRPSDDDVKARLIDFARALKPRGSTNTGDALRRARFVFKYAKNNRDVTKVSNYLVVVTDGDTRYGVLRDEILSDTEYSDRANSLPWLLNSGNDVATYDSNGEPTDDIQLRPRYVYNPDGRGIGFPGDLKDARKVLAGDGTILTEHAKHYMEKNGTLLMEESNPTSYLVAVSGEVSRPGRATLANAIWVPDNEVHIVLDGDEFDDAITDITESILQDLWFINGPRRYSID